MSMMVAIASGLKGNPKMMAKYGALTTDPKFFKEKIIKRKGADDIVETIPDKEAILSEIVKDVQAGNLKVEGTPLEAWHRMNVDAFRQYQRLHGEVYARVAQKRAFKAASGKDPDIYNKNPQRDFDVPVEDISFPKQYKSFDELPDRIEIKYNIDPDNGRPVINAIDKDTGKQIGGYYTDYLKGAGNKEEIEGWPLGDITDYLKQTTTLAKEKANK
jgi:uncharacterized FlaG/YvyC family protein